MKNFTLKRLLPFPGTNQRILALGTDYRLLWSNFKIGPSWPKGNPTILKVKDEAGEKSKHQAKEMEAGAEFNETRVIRRWLLFTAAQLFFLDESFLSCNFINLCRRVSLKINSLIGGCPQRGLLYRIDSIPMIISKGMNIVTMLLLLKRKVS